MIRSAFPFEPNTKEPQCKFLLHLKLLPGPFVATPSG
jgi:hypothetical protein